MPKQQVEFDPIDGLVVDEVGAWASEKHERLKKYIDASRGARAKFLPPQGSGRRIHRIVLGPRKITRKGYARLYRWQPDCSVQSSAEERHPFFRIILQRSRSNEVGGA